MGERRAAGEHVVEDAAERVDVGSGVDPLAPDLLRGDEVQRADPVPGLRRARLREHVLGEPEVGQVGVVALPEQDVGRLDVAVHQAGGVRGVERGADLPDDPRRARRVERPLAADERAQVVAGDVAHRDVGDPVLLARVVDRDHVRVVDRRRDARLAQEPPPDRLVGHQGRGDDLQRDDAVERELARAIDDAHPPAPRHGLDPVPRERAARRHVAHDCGVYRPRGIEEHSTFLNGRDASGLRGSSGAAESGGPGNRTPTYGFGDHHPSRWTSPPTYRQMRTERRF